MSSKSPIEEQNQIYNIIERWSIYGLWYHIPAFVFNVILFSSLYDRLALVFGDGLLLGALLGCGVGLSSGQLTTWYARKRFLQRLTDEERSLVSSLSAENAVGYGAVIKSFRRTLKKAEPPDELLRASAPPHDDDTLLRAATQNRDVPQEELLRSSHTSEP